MPKKHKKRRLSLAERRRRFVFSNESAFEPVERQDFCGAEHVLAALEPILHFLENFRGYSELGAELYSGAIFYGPTGTGKTYTARFLATESGAGFVDAREFPGKRESEYDTFSRDDIHTLFMTAKKYVQKTGKPLILFWDQFDSFLEDAGKDAISQLYVELDGVSGGSPGVFLVVATSQDLDDVELFDGQLLRKGRLGIKIPFTLPTRRQQLELLRYYLDKKPHEPVDCKDLIYFLTDPTPATIRDIVGDAYRNACRSKLSRKERGKITAKELLRALVDNMQGISLSLELSAREKRQTAIHELGHALVARELGWPVQMVSILPASDGLGKTITVLSWEEQMSDEDIRNDLAIDIGGLAAEHLLGISSGYGTDTDLKRFSASAKKFISSGGRGSALGNCYGPIVVKNEEELPVSQKLLEAMESDLGELLKSEYRRAFQILERVGKERIEFIAFKLLEKDPPIMLQDELDELRRAPI